MTRTKYVDCEAKVIKDHVPAEFLIIREGPTLQGDTCRDYIQYGLDCKATLEKKNEDTKSILSFLASMEGKN